jgi:hypothetical protein
MNADKNGDVDADLIDIGRTPAVESPDERSLDLRSFAFICGSNSLLARLPAPLCILTIEEFGR